MPGIPSRSFNHSCTLARTATTVAVFSGYHGVDLVGRGHRLQPPLQIRHPRLSHCQIWLGIDERRDAFAFPTEQITGPTCATQIQDSTSSKHLARAGAECLQRLEESEATNRGISQTRLEPCARLPEEFAGEGAGSKNRLP
jgi:hypothetical protein